MMDIKQTYCGNILIYIHIYNHYVVHLKLIQYVNYLNKTEK